MVYIKSYTKNSAVKGELVAKLKFWFGINEEYIFNEYKYIIEKRGDYVYVYKRLNA
jgi:hypothetical protein